MSREEVWGVIVMNVVTVRRRLKMVRELAHEPLLIIYHTFYLIDEFHLKV